MFSFRLDVTNPSNGIEFEPGTFRIHENAAIGAGEKVFATANERQTGASSPGEA